MVLGETPSLNLRSAPLHFAVPAAILLTAGLIVPRAGTLPTSWTALSTYGAYLLLALGGAVSVAFQRGRALLVIVTLASACLAQQYLLQPGTNVWRAYTVFALMTVLVPLNLTVAAVLTERGLFNGYGAQRLALIGLEIIAAIGVVRSGQMGVAHAVYASIAETSLLAASPIPQVGLVLLAATLIVTLVVWLRRRAAIDLGTAGAVAAFALGAHNITVPHAFESYIAAAALIVVAALLQDTFHMAFRDELTGLPGRRALNDRLAGLGRRYTIAMLDIDRFKGLNDHYGHDIGDQVLKMVGARLARVAGGGKAFRYGGEEFTVLFPGKPLNDVMDHLEALRQDIAGRRLAVRGADRPRHSKSAGMRRGTATAVGKSVSVTISIGAAENSAELASPEEVILAADKALYRAKSKGRNQVSL